MHIKISQFRKLIFPSRSFVLQDFLHLSTLPREAEEKCIYIPLDITKPGFEKKDCGRWRIMRM